MRKSCPLAAIRNRRLNSVALLDPLRPVQFSSVQFTLLQSSPSGKPLQERLLDIAREEDALRERPVLPLAGQGHVDRQPGRVV